MPNQQANASATTSNPSIPPYGVSEKIVNYHSYEHIDIFNTFESIFQFSSLSILATTRTIKIASTRNKFTKRSYQNVRNRQCINELKII